MLDNSDVVSKDKLKLVKIITPVKTRWKSTFMMLESIVKMRRILSSIRDIPGKDDTKLAPVIPSEDEFNLYDEILPILRRVAEISECFSADKEVSIHLVISNIYTLRHKCLDFIKTGAASPTAQLFHQKLVENLDVSFPDTGCQNLFYSVANLLNPLYKGRALKKLGGFDEAYEALITQSNAYQEWIAATRLFKERLHVEIQGHVSEDDPFYNVGMEEALALMTSFSGPAPPPKLDIVTEWEIFQKLPGIIGVDVLEFWRANKYKFPLLAQAAKKWLCVPASSASSERAFSAMGGIIVSYKRTKLQPEQVEKLLYIQQNYPKVQIKR